MTIVNYASSPTSVSEYLEEKLCQKNMTINMRKEDH
mgnify:CR=1 FL=1